MHKNATKCNETLSKWCKNKHGASKIRDTFETYHGLRRGNLKSLSLLDILLCLQGATTAGQLEQVLVGVRVSAFVICLPKGSSRFLGQSSSPPALAVMGRDEMGVMSRAHTMTTGSTCMKDLAVKLLWMCNRGSNEPTHLLGDQECKSVTRQLETFHCHWACMVKRGTQNRYGSRCPSQLWVGAAQNRQGKGRERIQFSTDLTIQWRTLRGRAVENNEYLKPELPRIGVEHGSR
jgi:hypothetical protein